jgi:hypothetical protein
MGMIRTGSIWQVAGLYCALTFALAYPLSLHPGSRVLTADADTNLFMWALAWDTHAFTHSPGSIFDANIYYPERHTLAFSENFIGSAFFAAPILWVTHNMVLAMNLIALLSCVLCGVGAFVLARTVGISPSGAMLSGVVFAFSPPRFFRIDQLHLTTIQWVPFGLAFLHKYFDDGRKRHLRLAAGFLTLQALTSGHGAVFLLLAMLVVVGCRLAFGETLALTARLRSFGVPGFLLLVPALLILIPYRQVQTEMGLTRAVGEWITVPSSFLASPAHLHKLVLSALSATTINETANAYLFPGYLPLMLAAAAFIPWRGDTVSSRTRSGAGWTRAAAALELTALISLGVAALVTLTGAVRPKWGDAVLFSIRTPLRAWVVFALSAAARIAIVRRAPFDHLIRIRRGIDAVPSVHARLEELRRWSANNRGNPTVAYGLITFISVWLAAGPSARLWPLVYWLPGLNFIRVPSRFTLLAVLSLAVLAGVGFDRLTARLTSRRRRLVAAITAVWLVAEFAAVPLGTEPYRVNIPSVDRWLAGQPTPFVVAEVPLGDERRHTEYMLHSTAHWQKTVEGYSGFRPPRHAVLYRQLRKFPDEASLDALSALGVNYVVVHTDLYPPAEWPVVDARIRSFATRLELVDSEGAGRVYTLRPRPR